MFKLVLLLRKRPDMTDAEFRDYYENHHARIGTIVLGTHARRYFRRYLTPATASGQQNLAHFDVTTEFWFESRADYDAMIGGIDATSAAGLPRHIADEVNLFAPVRSSFFIVEERESELPAAGRQRKHDLGGNMFKLVILLRKRQDLSDAAFRDYYENHHSLLATPVLAKHALRYFRRYIAPMSAAGDENIAHFDVISEVWFENKAAYDATMREIGATNLATLMAEDEANLFDPGRSSYFVADEGESTLPAAG